MRMRSSRKRTISSWKVTRLRLAASASAVSSPSSAAEPLDVAPERFPARDQRERGRVVVAVDRQVELRAHPR